MVALVSCIVDGVYYCCSFLLFNYFILSLVGMNSKLDLSESTFSYCSLCCFGDLKPGGLRKIRKLEKLLRLAIAVIIANVAFADDVTVICISTSDTEWSCSSPKQKAFNKKE